jgi:hypothetical protein
MADTAMGNPFAPALDPTDVATKTGLLAQYQVVSGNAAATANDMYNDVMEPGNKAREAKAGQVTNANGVFTVTYPVGFWAAEPSINVAPVSATGGSGQLTFKVAKVLASNAWTITVTFAMLPAAVTVVVAGSTTLWVNPGVVTFDYQSFSST